jgi:benzylsuccinate CoA-transferase BbsF subunit
MQKKLLEGVKVADFGWVAEGPMTAKYLADYGAEVIRLEGRTRPEIMRSLGPFKEAIVDYDRSGSFNQWNTSKLSLAVNLTKPEGVEVAKRLVAWSDVVVENFSGGAIERMGLGYEELKKVKTDIIMLSTCMQGQTGPHASSPGSGVTLPALTGYHHIAGWPDGLPTSTGAYTDWVALHFNVVAILAALDYRRRTGKGQHLDMSQYEHGVHFLAPLVLDYFVNGRVAGRTGNRCDYAAPHGAFRCRGAERWCAIGVFSDEEWEGFCKVLGNPEWTNSPRFANILERKKNEDELEKLVEAWTVNQSAEDVMTMMQAAGVGAGVVENAEDIMEHDPQLKHRQFFWELEHPTVGNYRAPRAGFVLSKVPCELRRAPLLGEHNEYVLKEVLSLSDEEIAELIASGAIE